ncbi:MAG: hybrid sensor histidine kinase/response regulator [candidate division KSB1 bacterium]|nr:hybrid sensor histidine kinase/response regulator [candidate division KSB1 bacterium]MDZ7303006.1 hybrid sensor histidine kinase/response regulator [candidate division KSB1 bacterium]MDZ7312486.1 hybrid sensor histidine kinase/response regulator [candidate division KSB1 bacterium]
MSTGKQNGKISGASSERGMVPAARPFVLVIDDEEAMRDSCRQILAKEGYVTDDAENGLVGLRKIEELKPDLVIIDLKMPGLNGLEVLDKIQGIDTSIIPIVITGYATVESAVDAMKRGAYDFLPKPFTPEELRIIIRRGLEKRKLLREAESLRREKQLMEENFITMVSHQLRSPLVAVLQYFETILAGAAGEIPEKPKGMIARAGNRLQGLLQLINDWLDMARISSGQIVEKLRPVSLRKILKKLMDDLQPLVQSYDVSLEFGPCSENDFVQGDEETLEQVFSNLITNAIKYNKPKGRVIIAIEENENFIAAKVQDTGIGIASEHLPFIFDQFYRVRKSADHTIKGTGLGLTIAKKIVEAHGGSVQVSSQVGQGSIFTVLLPRANEGFSCEREQTQ